METIKASVTPSTGWEYDFPEQTPEFNSATSNCGICFSGGGTRAMSAAMGQMRALNELQLLPRARYISGVSGGSWAASIYTYSKAGDDTTLLGHGPDDHEREAWLLDDWENNLKSGNLAYPATKNFRDVVVSYLDNGPHDMAWIHAVRDVFFKPFNLEQSCYFSQDAATVENILEENKLLQPGWSASDFATTAPDRPYLIVNATLMWPIAIGHEIHRVLIQFTPLYVGNPWAKELREHHPLEHPSRQNTGGGVLSNYAFGTTGPNAAPAANLDMAKPSKPFSIWHASGISSASFGYDDAKSHLGLADEYIPRVEYWAVSDATRSVEKSKRIYLTDGGNLENTGLMAMLQRQVKKIVVFVNSETRIRKHANGEIEIDSDIAPLFGHHNHDFPNNTVFDPSSYQDLLDGLWQSYSEEKNLCMFNAHYTTRENQWFGTPAYDVEILWVYNSPVKKWIAQLSQPIRDLITRGLDGEGPLKDFPNYETIGEKWFHLIELNPPQVTLIADMFAWSIHQNEDTFTKMLPEKG